MIKGMMRVKIDGLNTGKILNKLIEDGVILKNIKEKSKSVTFEMKAEQEEILKKNCKRFHKSYEIISKITLINWLKNLRYFVGFAVAILLCASLFFSFNMYVYNINLNASYEFDLSNIEKLLNDNNIKTGMKKQDLSAREIENLILKTQNDVAGCTVKMNGGVLDIMIYPGLLKQEKSNENIYSNYNAVITDIEIYAGVTDFKVGDVVQKGDLLIKNNNGASGMVMAKIYYSDYIIYNENKQKIIKTGNKQIKKYLSIFNKNLFKSKDNCTFSEYLEEKCVFCVSKNLLLPLQYVVLSYEEVVIEETVIPFETQEEMLKQNLYQSVIEKIDKEKITNVTYSVVKENHLTRLDVFVECEIDITK